jgi:lipoprotein-anchoring transpeptidase ErfK/SrfK
MTPAPTPDGAVLVVDAANVVGSRPDGWWRDRPGAAARLHATLGAAGVGEVVLVLEGRARAGVPEQDVAGVRVVHANGFGDDRVVEEASALTHSGRRVTVVTADRELVERVTALGGDVIGPRTLLDRLDASPGPPAVRLRPLAESDLAVEDAASGEHVGVVGIQRRRPELEAGDVNLTYAVYAGRRGRGYATAAVRAAMVLALERGPVGRFVIRCDPANVDSAAVARRAGFIEHGPVAEPDGAALLRFTLPVG